MRYLICICVIIPACLNGEIQSTQLQSISQYGKKIGVHTDTLYQWLSSLYGVGLKELEEPQLDQVIEILQLASTTGQSLSCASDEYFQSHDTSTTSPDKFYIDLRGIRSLRTDRYVLYKEVPDRMNRWALSKRRNTIHTVKLIQLTSNWLDYKRRFSFATTKSIPLSQIKAIGRYTPRYLPKIVSTTGILIYVGASLVDTLWYLLFFDRESLIIGSIWIAPPMAIIRTVRYINGPSPKNVVILTGTDEEKWDQIIKFVEQ